MENARLIERLSSVINTLNNATVRADQVDAVLRINACTKELTAIIDEVNAAKKEPNKAKEVNTNG